MSGSMGCHTNISHLPVQLLSRILACLDLTERLQSAALVSTTWSSAAIMATSRVLFNSDTVDGAATLPSLSSWLLAHSQTAGVTSITAWVMGALSGETELPELQLPVQQLQGLEKLYLYNVKLSAAGRQEGSSTTAEAVSSHSPILPALTALTSLQLMKCEVQLEGLSTLTGLQSLVLLPLPASVDATEVSGALPSLHRLDTLHLSGALTQDSAAQHISGLSCLENLYLGDSMCSAVSLQNLPKSLTNLSLLWAPADGADNGDGDGAVTHSPPINAENTPGLCQLTALRHLHVQHATAFSVEVLARLTGLEELRLKTVNFRSPGMLSVLTALTKLKHLELPWLAPMFRPSSTDVAAVTASTHLTLLDIGDSIFDSSYCATLFARELPHLVELHANLDILDGRRAGGLGASCCPNLERLRLGPGADDGDDDLNFGDEAARPMAAMLRRWRANQGLTSLILNAQYKPMEQCVWEALGGLTQLCDLELQFMHPAFLDGMLALDTCCHLTHLKITATDPETFTDTQVETFGGTIEGEDEEEDSTVTIHQELPEIFQHAVVNGPDGFGRHPRLVEALLRLSADTQQQQQEANAELRAQNANLQDQVADLQQQVGGLSAAAAAQQAQLDELQASLAAALEQLQGR